jgi:hypothetical protein
MKEKEIQFAERRFNNIVTADNLGDINLPHYGIEYDLYDSLLKKMEIIIRVKGFFRGKGETSGKWMRKEDIVRILRQDPEWIHINQIAEEYGI